MQNILNVSNTATAGIGSDGFGGETSQNYTYDNLYQLTNANGSWLNRQGHTHKYTLDMSYDTIGNRLPLNNLLFSASYFNFSLK